MTKLLISMGNQSFNKDDALEELEEQLECKFCPHQNLHDLIAENEALQEANQALEEHIVELQVAVLAQQSTVQNVRRHSRRWQAHR